METFYFESIDYSVETFLFCSFWFMMFSLG